MFHTCQIRNKSRDNSLPEQKSSTQCKVYSIDKTKMWGMIIPILSTQPSHYVEQKITIK